MIMKIYVTIYTYIEQSAPGRWNGRVLQKHLDRSIHVGLTAPTGLVVGPDNKVVLFSSYIDSSGFTTKIHSLQSWEEGWVVEKVELNEGRGFIHLSYFTTPTFSTVRTSIEPTSTVWQTVKQTELANKLIVRTSAKAL